MFAVRQGHIGAAKALLKAGADVNEPVQVRANPKLPEGERPIRAGTTPLDLAVANGHFELAAELLDAGADPNSNRLGYTALHMLVYIRQPGIGDNDPGPEGSGTMSSLEFAKRLVAKGADVNARITRRVNLTNTRFHDIGASPYLLAAMTADAEYMKALVALGADPSLKNAEGSTALMTAAGLGTRSPGEDAGTEEEVIEAMQVALDHGADINAVDVNGETAMHGAAYKNLPRAVKFLADKGARIDIWNTTKQVRMDAADDRARLQVRQLQAISRDGRGTGAGDARGGRHSAEREGRKREGIRHLRPGESAQAAALSAGSRRSNSLSSSRPFRLGLVQTPGGLHEDSSAGSCRRFSPLFSRLSSPSQRMPSRRCSKPRFTASCRTARAGFFPASP